jgi:hypothetical protein
MLAFNMVATLLISGGKSPFLSSTIPYNSDAFPDNVLSPLTESATTTTGSYEPGSYEVLSVSIGFLGACISLSLFNNGIPDTGADGAMGVSMVGNGTMGSDVGRDTNDGGADGSGADGGADGSDADGGADGGANGSGADGGAGGREGGDTIRAGGNTIGVGGDTTRVGGDVATIGIGGGINTPSNGGASGTSPGLSADVSTGPIAPLWPVL